MLRFVVGPGGSLVADFARTLPGRGIWLSAERDVIETARRTSRLTRAMARAAGGAVVVPADLLARLESGLVERIVELLKSARRARQVVAGEKLTRIWLAEGCVGLWLDAAGGDAAAARPLAGAVAEPPFVGVPRAVLEAAFGPEWVGPCAVRRGRLAEAVRNEAGRLAEVRKS